MPRHRITILCPICGKTFSPHPCEYRNGTRCCSRPCSLVRRRMKKRSAEERFWEKVERRGPDECWLWQGGKVYFGYGIFCPEHGQNIGTHRFAWQLTHGTIPEGLFVCHACDQPACVNVAHLFLGTQHDNLADMRRKGRDHSKPPPPMLGEAHPQAKLTAEQVLSIRNRRNETRATLATEYGVSAGTIKSIRRGATWKHLL